MICYTPATDGWRVLGDLRVSVDIKCPCSHHDIISTTLLQDKVSINLLSMVAEDFSDRESSSNKIYKVIRDRLLTAESSNFVLPVMYVLDSILKNNHKQQPEIFRSLVEQDAAEWMPTLHRRLDANQRVKLQKVWKTWYNDTFRLFDETTWKTMGQCFTSSQAATTMPTVSGIARTVRSYACPSAPSASRWFFIAIIIAEGRLAHSSAVPQERNAKYTRRYAERHYQRVGKGFFGTLGRNQPRFAIQDQEGCSGITASRELSLFRIE
jgi:hypothetical protein